MLCFLDSSLDILFGLFWSVDFLVLQHVPDLACVSSSLCPFMYWHIKRKVYFIYEKTARDCMIVENCITTEWCLLPQIRARLCMCLLKVLQSQAIWALVSSSHPIPRGPGITNNMKCCCAMKYRRVRNWKTLKKVSLRQQLT